MKRKKKTKAPVNTAKETQERYRAYIKSIKLLFEKMVGPGYFEMLSPKLLAQFYKNRYPALKIIIDDDVIADTQSRESYRASITGLIKKCTLTLPSGEQIFISTFFTDLALIVHFVEFLSSHCIKEHVKMRTAFAPYLTSGDWLFQTKTRAFYTLSFTNEQFYDPIKGTLQFDVSDLALTKPGGRNQIRLRRLKNKLDKQEIDGFARPIVAIGDASVFVGDWTQWIQFDPARFGITHISDAEAKPLYIQHHALNRFEERTYSPKGFIQIYLAQTFIYGTPEVIVYRGQVLIACYCARHKVGYFLVSYHGDKWIIRTFLFLTNEGTPEGTKLKEIIGLEKEDAKYLMIDRVTAFLDYDIEHDQRLRDLFETAGCGSLFEYIKLFVRPEDGVKNSASIANYLFGKADEYGESIQI
ncbi:hypothetical protein [Sphingobacterium sp. DR205]|uniref:hypothetical protein n=1 Tax=Sphingobacterium sp. DR205 TaxID=2713573 RepID=UPI0013E502F7|nr:hypothetical protein [Sphingobacterium sp. DR205]QIH35539.1 hypothetical protein G6053_22840 [Sphingobacterium sp. DR205]